MFKKLLISFAALIVAIVASELVHRAYLAIQGRPYVHAAQRQEIALLIEREDGQFDGKTKRQKRTAVGVHPFFGFESLRRTEDLEHDIKRSARLGKLGEYRILVLGGSVAAGFGNHGKKALKAALRRDPRFQGRRITVFEYGVAAFKQPQQLNLLQYLLTMGLEVDAVLTLDGFNEVALSCVNHENNVHPLFPSYRQWLSLNSTWQSDGESLVMAARIHTLRDQVSHQATQALDSPWLYSSLGGTWLQRRLTTLSNHAVDLQNQFLDRLTDTSRNPSLLGPPFDRDQRAALQLSVRAWRDAAHTSYLLCKTRNIDYLHVLQPTLHDVGSKPITPEEERRGEAQDAWLWATEHGYPMLRLAGESLGNLGVAFLDATQVFAEVTDTLYIDACHFNEEGNEILAEAIAESFLASLPEDPGTPPR